MTRFRNTVTIDRPIDEVFRFVANFENMSKWNYFSLVMRFTLEATGTSTNLTDEWEVGVGSGLLGVLGFLAAGRVKAAVRENLGKLKHLLENREVRLQDGRVETI